MLYLLFEIRLFFTGGGAEPSGRLKIVSGAGASEIRQIGGTNAASTHATSPSSNSHSGQVSFKIRAGNTKGGSITVLLTSCFIGLESVV